MPRAARIAVLVNPADPERVEAVLAEAHAAARAATLEVQVLKASTSSEIDAAFAKLDRADALSVGPDGFLIRAGCSLHCWRSAMQFRRIMRRGSMPMRAA